VSAKRRFCAVCLLLVASSPNAAERPLAWLCTPHLTTGFQWDNSRQDWIDVQFEQLGAFILEELQSPEDEIDGRFYSYRTISVGHALPPLNCSRILLADLPASRASCGGLGYGILIDLQTLRYTGVYTPGFMDGDRSSGPYIEIGFCEPIEEALPLR